MSISVTNQIASSATRGEVVEVTLNSTDAAKLPNITVGMQCIAITSLKVGYVYSVDTLGNTFKIKPQYPSGFFDNGTPGELSVNDIINLN